MKKIVALALALFATSTFASVLNTPHDLATQGKSACQYCHMPHNSLSTSTGTPIWARALNNSITPYSSARLPNGTANLTATSYSLLCMSCHDGTTQLGTLHNTTTLPVDYATGTITGTANLGQTLVNDHPVGVVYPSAGTFATESGLVDRTTATGRGYVFFSNNIECGSCHDPHIWGATGTANELFKRTISNAPNGDFCAGCHGLK